MEPKPHSIDDTLAGSNVNGISKIADLFNQYFPNGTIGVASIEEIPKEAMDYFEGGSASFIPPEDYREGNFEQFFVINHNNGSKTYVATQTKTYDSKGDTERLTYLVDMDEDGKYVGHGEVRFNISNLSEYFKDKPFVGFTRTEEGNEGRGLGTRRLYIMNALSQALYGHPLNSDTLIAKEAKSLWEKLVKTGEAKLYKEGKHDRYVFLERMPGSI